MTSKTFKSAVSAGHLNIHDSKRGLITVSISRDKAILEMIDLKTETAPALALAILEAAGVESPYYNLGDAVGNLRRHVEREARYAAEAKEQAELEAEALDFLNVSREAKHLGPLGNFDDHTKDAWLAVARKAREMRKS